MLRRPSEIVWTAISFIVALMAVLIVLLLWITNGKATTYSMIDDQHKAYCAEYARIEAMRSTDKMFAMNEAYGDCIRILPTRLPMPVEPGTVPAADRPKNESWSAACAAEYRTWDAETGTVVRRGSPERVECPLVLRDGKWVIP